MAEGKNSFTAYCDWGSVFDEMTNEEAGVLVKHLFDYVRDKNPEAKDTLTRVSFAQIKSTLKRDLDKWIGKSNKNRINANIRHAKNKKTTEKAIVVASEKKETFNFRRHMVDYGFQEDLVIDWMKVRKTKKATNTKTAFQGFIIQVQKLNLDKNYILAECVSRSWSGLKAAWLEKETPTNTKTINRQSEETIRKNIETFDVDFIESIKNK